MATGLATAPQHRSFNADFARASLETEIKELAALQEERDENSEESVGAAGMGMYNELISKKERQVESLRRALAGNGGVAPAHPVVVGGGTKMPPPTSTTAHDYREPLLDGLSEIDDSVAEDPDMDIFSMALTECSVEGFTELCAPRMAELALSTSSGAPPQQPEQAAGMLQGNAEQQLGEMNLTIADAGALVAGEGAQSCVNEGEQRKRSSRGSVKMTRQKSVDGDTISFAQSTAISAADEGCPVPQLSMEEAQQMMADAFVTQVSGK